MTPQLPARRKPILWVKEVKLSDITWLQDTLFPRDFVTHVHDVSALVEDLHVGLQDVEVKGRCQQAAMPTPLVTFAEQQPISWAQETDIRNLSY